MQDGPDFTLDGKYHVYAPVASSGQFVALLMIMTVVCKSNLIFFITYTRASGVRVVFTRTMNRLCVCVCVCEPQNAA